MAITTDARAPQASPTLCAFGLGACTDTANRRRFLVEVTRPDGSVDRTVAHGGCSFDHTFDGMERGGLGSVVRVKPLPSFLGLVT